MTTALVHTPTNNDVLLGWENRTETHAGNLHLKQLIDERAVEYVSSDYVDAKTMIVRQVVEELSEDGARFLCKSSETGDAWKEASREYVLENVKQAFREKVSTLNIPSSVSLSPSSTGRKPSPSSPMLKSQQSALSRLPNTVTPPSLSPSRRIQSDVAKQILYRRLANRKHSIAAAATMSPLNQAMHRRKLHAAQMRAAVLQKQKEQQQLLQLVHQQQQQSANDATALHHALRVGQHPAMRARELPDSLRITPLGQRRQIDPLAPHRKRKRGSVL